MTAREREDTRDARKCEWMIPASYEVPRETIERREPIEFHGITYAPERTCRWVWLEKWSDTEGGRECDYASWALDCGCWDGWDEELYGFDDPETKPDKWKYCPRCVARIIPSFIDLFGILKGDER